MCVDSKVELDCAKSEVAQLLKRVNTLEQQLVMKMNAMEDAKSRAVREEERVAELEAIKHARASEPTKLSSSPVG